VGEAHGDLRRAIDRVLRAIANPTETREPYDGRVELLRKRFALSPFETDVLVLCAGHAIAPDVAARLGGRPTLGSALARVPDAHIDATAPTRPLRRYRLVTLAPQFPAFEAPLSIDERVLNYLLAIETIDEHLLPHVAPLLTRLPPPTDAQRTVVDRIARLLARADVVSTIQLHGGDAMTRLAVLQAAATSRGITLLRLRASTLVIPPQELDLLQRLVERETLLGEVLPIVELDALDGSDVTKAVRTFVDGSSVPIAISAPDPISFAKTTSTSLALPPVTAAERFEAWTQALAGRDFPVGKLAQQFQLEPDEIANIAAALDDTSTFEETWSACRDISRPRLDDLARKIEPIATWDSLVLAPSGLATLHELVRQLEHRHTVHEQWGLARGDARGQAITALFHGPSGTGKTHAAEILARAANLDLFHIDLSQVVDKYVGETEKRLRRIFDAAERGGAVLLFDEADALFGKRGTIERGTDRWANIEVSYLLQRMERYHGLAILTTNAKDSLDQAFMRRLRFVVPFPFPDVTLRVELWRRIFPPDVPLVGLDPARLAKLQLTGANIKNVAIKAAFHAAHEHTPVTMSHILAAARSEFAKLEMPFPELEMRARG